ncbi:hypothetical protein L1766_06930, partial [Thermovorax subterraneus]|nr:hypothetical protein [Thermovorax subterraneus]
RIFNIKPHTPFGGLCCVLGGEVFFSTFASLLPSCHLLKFYTASVVGPSSKSKSSVSLNSLADFEGQCMLYYKYIFFKPAEKAIKKTEVAVYVKLPL